jgi:hypothetical protein
VPELILGRSCGKPSLNDSGTASTPISRPMMAAKGWFATGICPSTNRDWLSARLRSAMRISLMVSNDFTRW